MNIVVLSVIYVDDIFILLFIIIKIKRFLGNIRVKLSLKVTNLY
jgi:hypothetical protein